MRGTLEIFTTPCFPLQQLPALQVGCQNCDLARAAGLCAENVRTTCCMAKVACRAGFRPRVSRLPPHNALIHAHGSQADAPTHNPKPTPAKMPNPSHSQPAQQSIHTPLRLLPTAYCLQLPHVRLSADPPRPEWGSEAMSSCSEMPASDVREAPFVRLAELAPPSACELDSGRWDLLRVEEPVGKGSCSPATSPSEWKRMGRQRLSSCSRLLFWKCVTSACLPYKAAAVRVRVWGSQQA